eukprot:12311295-Alexandrium_andersonii.AAC.1
MDERRRDLRPCWRRELASRRVHRGQRHRRQRRHQLPHPSPPQAQRGALAGGPARRRRPGLAQ